MSLKHDIKGTVKCPKCGKTIQKSLGELQSNPRIKCACGATIGAAGADGPARSLDKFEKTMKKLGAKRR